MVWHFQCLKRCLNPLWGSLFDLTLDIEPKLSVNAVNPFVIPFISGIADSQKQLPKSVSRMFLGKVIQYIDYFMIITPLRRII